MIAGGTVSAWIGAGFLTTIPKHHVSKIVAALLLLVATVLVLEAVFPLSHSGGIVMPVHVEIAIAIAVGFLIGAISSMLAWRG